MFFRQQNQQTPEPQAQTKGKPKQQVKNPKDTDFYSLHFLANVNTRLLGISGQILSAITEAIAVLKLLNFSFPIWQLQNVIPVLTALFCVYVFEYLGIRIYLVQVVRHFAVKKSKDTDTDTETETETEAETETKKTKWQHKFLLSLNMFFLIVILTSNAGMSIVGQKSMFQEKTTATATDEVFTLNEERNAKILQLQKQIQEGHTAANDNNTTEKTEITNQYNTSVNTEKERLKVELEGIKEAKKNDKAASLFYDAKILTANNKSQETLKTLQADFNNKIAAINGKFDDAILLSQIDQINQSYDDKINNLQTKTSQKTGFWKILDKVMMWLLIGFMLLSWLSIIYEEIYRAGSEMVITVEYVEEKPNLLELLWERLTHWFYHYSFVAITAIFGTTKYQYKEPSKEIKIYEPKPLFIRKETRQTTKTAIGFNNRKTEINNCDTKNYVETETETETKNKDDFWRNYTENGIRNFYKRGVLGIDSSGRKAGPKSQSQNKEKYEAVKREAQKFGIEFIETSDTLKFKK